MDKSLIKDVGMALRIASRHVSGSKEAMDFTNIAPLIAPDKKLSDRDITRAIRLAIAAELDAVHLYEIIADSTDNNDVKKLMTDIANEEKVHASELDTLLSMFDKDNEKFKEKGEEEVNTLLGKKALTVAKKDWEQSFPNPEKADRFMSYLKRTIPDIYNYCPMRMGNRVQCKNVPPQVYNNFMSAVSNFTRSDS